MNLLDPLGWAIVLMVLGCGVLILEVFVPSGGVLGFLAALVMVASIVMAFRRDLTTGLSFILAALVVAPMVVGLAFRFWPRTPMGKAFLGELQTEEDVRPDDARRQLLGRVGVAQSKMLPSGAVLIEGHLIDAVSQGMAIEVGDPVVVIEVRANRVIVRKAHTDEVQTAQLPQEDVLSRPIEEFGLESLDDVVS